jgi:hypothetical protein
MHLGRRALNPMTTSERNAIHAEQPPRRAQRARAIWLLADIAGHAGAVSVGYPRAPPNTGARLHAPCPPAAGRQRGECPGDEHGDCDPERDVRTGDCVPDHRSRSARGRTGRRRGSLGQHQLPWSPRTQAE